MIKTIKWNNNDVLGNLRLNFTKSDGSAFNTIVIAGENGAGKTTVLETISTFLNLGTIEPFEEITYDVNGTTYSVYPSDKNAHLGFHKRKILLMVQKQELARTGITVSILLQKII